MAAPSIGLADRYFDVGSSKVYWVPAIANQDAPTRSELNAGTDLSPDVADFEGFSVSAEEIETPDLSNLFTSKIGGRTSADDSSLTMYASIDGQDVRQLLPLGTQGFIVWMDGGDVVGHSMDVYPVRVRSTPKQRSTSDASRIQIQFSISKPPSENLVIPA